MNKSVGIIIAIILVVGIGGWVYHEKNASLSPDGGYTTPATSAGSESINPGSGTSASTTPASAAGAYTMAQVAKHNSRTSCWAVISGSVYDLTSWIPNHPGGEQAILSLCGTDGTAKFNGQHGSDNRAKTILAGFKIGTLTQ